MQIIKHPSKSEWKDIATRPTLANSNLMISVKAILEDVRLNGDKAVLEYEKRFDHVQLDCLAVTEEEIVSAEKLVPQDLKEAILLAKANIEKFHKTQCFVSQKIETLPGVVCWQKAVGIEKVGLYIPGGNAPLFSTVLMSGIPAQIAGCEEIVMCTPPLKDGSIHPAILFAAQVSGIKKVFKIGGVQAIAAMAYGTESVPAVYKIVGPGNQYVTAAKQLITLQNVAIDMPAGPSEVEVIADETANPAFVAADLLSQAEHGVDSQSILVTTSEMIIDQVINEVEKQLDVLPSKNIAVQSMKHSRIILLKNRQEVVEFTNLYAPEHLIIQTKDYSEIADGIVNAGSVFLGYFTPESAGDYASGTNHTLPTNGYSKMYSGLSVDSFIKKITFQEISREGIAQLGPALEVMAEAELLPAHKNAVSLRISQ